MNGASFTAYKEALATCVKQPGRQWQRQLKARLLVMKKWGSAQHALSERTRSAAAGQTWVGAAG